MDISTGDVVIHDITKTERIGVHSHITGLGAAENLEIKHNADGMVGQLDARRAAALVVKIVKVS